MLIAIVASIVTGAIRPRNGGSMHNHLHHERPHGIRKDLHWYKGKKENFEAFDLVDVKIIENCKFNMLYFMQYYTALYINAENPNLNTYCGLDRIR